MRVVARSALRWERRDGPLIFFTTLYTLFGALFVVLGVSGGFRGWSLWVWSTVAGVLWLAIASFNWIVVSEVLRNKA